MTNIVRITKNIIIVPSPEKSKIFFITKITNITRITKITSTETTNIAPIAKN